MEHKLEGGTLSAEDNGVIGRCVCGWTTGHRFSSFIASNAFRDHKEEAQERKRNRDRE